MLRSSKPAAAFKVALVDGATFLISDQDACLLRKIGKLQRGLLVFSYRHP